MSLYSLITHFTSLFFHIIIIIIIINLIDSLQKTAILGTSHIIQKALQCEA
jgi:hypothetical protein